MVKRINPPDKVYLAKSTISGAGRGMFAAQPIQKGETIEVAPVVEIVEDLEQEKIGQTVLRHHYFRFEETKLAICLGYGSIYNHSYTPNATYNKQPQTQSIEFIAIRNIAAGEEIFTNYNGGDPGNKNNISWIDDISRLHWG